MKNWWWRMQKHNYLVVKLGCLFLLVALFYRVLFSRSIEQLATVINSDSSFDETVLPPSVDVPQQDIKPLIPKDSSFEEDSVLVPAVLPDGVVVVPQHDIKPMIPKGEIENGTKCDLLNGDWIPNPSGPVYTNETCKWIADHQNCLMNGRPDTDYLYWRWKPRGCDLARMNPGKFLDSMRNKAWGFIGDSITRNHVQSLICILSEVEAAVEVYHDEEYRCRKWLFPTYNVTVSVIWSPFLAEAAIFEDINGVSTKEIEIHLDKLDSRWTREFETFDYVMFSSGKWYVKTAIYYEKNTIIGCHSCPERKNLTELGFDFAYRQVLKTVFEFITRGSGPGHNNGKKIFFRTSTPDHFEHGGWSEGGNCNRTKPVKDGEFGLNELVRILRNVELEEFENRTNSFNVELFDVTSLSLLRPDGHPGPYRYFQPFGKDKNTGKKIVNDCLHWCLPGPIDAWSDVLMEMVVRSY